MRIASVGVVAAVVFAFVLSTQAARAQYTYSDFLPDSGYTLVNPNGIEGTTIYGIYTTSTDVYGSGFTYDGTTFTSINDPNAIYGTQVEGMSGSTVVGSYGVQYGSHGFIYDGSTYVTVDDPNEGRNGTVLLGISGSNVVGYYHNNTGGDQGFLYNGSSFTPIDDPLALSIGGTFPAVISGNLVMGAYEDSNFIFHGFILNGSTYTTFDDPQGQATYITGVSGNDIVGYYQKGNMMYGFVYDGTTFTTIADPNATPGSDFVGGTYLTGMSNGVAVGYYIDGDNQPGFEAIEAPEPSGFLLLSCGMGAVLVARRIRLSGLERPRR